MTPRRAPVLEAVYAAFPPRVVLGVITPHECEECAAIRQALEGRTWHEISPSFAEEFSGSLPLLSPDAYNAFLPVWLRAAIEKPDGEAAAMVSINLGNEPSKFAFTPSQALALVAAVEHVAATNGWGAEDEGNIEHLAAVRAYWSGGVA